MGGTANVRSLTHCVTRLRFELKDESRADTEALEGLGYVLNVIQSGGQYQVVIGPAVADYYAGVTGLLDAAGQDAGGRGEDADASAAEQKRNPLDTVLKVVSGAFSPIIPLMAGSGMIKAVFTLLTTVGWLSDASSTYLVLSVAGNACFYFLPMFLGYTISKQLGVEPFVGAAIGAVLLEPNFTGLIGAEDTDFRGLGLQGVGYGSTVFPIFIAASVYSLLDRGLRRVVQKDLQYFVVPMTCLLLMEPFTALVFGPFGNNIGNLVADGVAWLFQTSRFVAGVVLGAAAALTVLWSVPKDERADFEA